MTIQADATFEGGVFRPSTPIALAEGATVHLVILPAEAAAPVPSQPQGGEHEDFLAGVIGICDSGPDYSLAERHDEFLYGIKKADEESGR